MKENVMVELVPANKKAKAFSIMEILFIAGVAIVPLFASFPYRVNIFLSWEGAYRMSQGQVPFRDFGMPMGYMYWVIPAIFFKLFGTQLITLVKAQVFINIISGLAFLSILKSLQIQRGIRLLSVVVYVLSYSFFNFWPWYNHTVIVYEMVGLAFLFMFFRAPETRKAILFLLLSALFIFFSFFTKQDGGGLSFLFCCVLLAYDCFRRKKSLPLILFVGCFVLFGFAFILPLTQYNFVYWFNHGQPPHTARFSVFEIMDEFFSNSQWIKFYLLIIGLIVMAFYKKQRNYFKDRNEMLFLLLTLGIIAEAAILQVTSYTPPDNNIFFHSFAFVFIFSSLSVLFHLNFFGYRILVPTLCGVLIWWSSSFWKYFQRIAERTLAQTVKLSPSGENIVNRKTYKIVLDSTDIPESKWGYIPLKSFHKIYLPQPTIEGINRFLALTRNRKDLRILNMTELTPLAAEVPYQLETGSNIPLWYHLGVGMFNKQADEYEHKIAVKIYDFVLFEYIPSLNNFYPFRVRDSLGKNYLKIDSFPAPRRGDTPGKIELYKRL